MIRDLFTYLWKNKLWWLLPPIIIFLIFGVLLIFTAATNPVSPFVYTFF